MRKQIISVVSLTLTIGRLRRNFFLRLEELWGPRTVDCFANFYTPKLPRFFSPFWNPETSGVDFFVQNLESQNCLVVPLVSLIARVLHYPSLQKARPTIVIPVWLSSSFRPLLTSQPKPFMKDCYQQNGSEALTLGRNLNSFLGSVNFTGNVVAVSLEFL